MNGFWGNFKSTLDTKGRINFPARFRKNLTEADEDTLIIIRGSEKYLAVYPLTAWRQFVDKLKAKIGNDRQFGIVSRRLMFGSSEQSVDKQGRLNLTAGLIEYAQLDGEVAIVGVENKIEVWDASKYREYVEATETDFLKIAHELDI